MDHYGDEFHSRRSRAGPDKRQGGSRRSLDRETEDLSMDLLALAKAHIEAENQHDLDATMDTVAPGGAFSDIHPTNQTTNSREVIRELYADASQAIPDMHIQIHNAVVDEAKRQVFIQYTF